jgi:hypothetical protein
MYEKNMLFGTMLMLSMMATIIFALNMKRNYIKISRTTNIVCITAAAAALTGTMLYASAQRGPIRNDMLLY